MFTPEVRGPSMREHCSQYVRTVFAMQSSIAYVTCHRCVDVARQYSTTMDPALRPPSKRERNRVQTTDEITAAALRQVEAHGASGLSLRSVARELSMSVAGLYRYFDTRDALLLRLIEDGFDDLGAALRLVESDDPRVLLVQRLHAYRSWARMRPRVFNLLFTDPIPGFVAPVQGPTDRAARRALAPLIQPAAALIGANAIRPSRAATTAMVAVWSSVHGYVMLEVYNHLLWANIKAERTYSAIVDTAVDELAARFSMVRTET